MARERERNVEREQLELVNLVANYFEYLNKKNKINYIFLITDKIVVRFVERKVNDICLLNITIENCVLNFNSIKK